MAMMLTVSYLWYGTLCLIPEVRRVEESDGSAERLHELENGESRRGLFFEDAAKYGGDLEDFQANNFFLQTIESRHFQPTCVLKQTSEKPSKKAMKITSILKRGKLKYPD